MSRPTTRAKNANQHPGHIVLEGMQRRRTTEQKRADDEHAEQEHLELETVREKGIKRISNIVDLSVQREEHVRTHPPQPRPRLRIVHKASASQAATEQQMEGSEPKTTSPDLEMELEHRGSAETVPLDIQYGTQPPNEMLYTGKDTGNQEKGVEPGSVAGQKRKQTTTNAAVKEDFSGLGKIADWADKITAAKPVHTLLAQRSRGRGRGSRSGRTASSTGSNTSSQRNLKARRGTPASVTSNTRPSTPCSNPGSLNVALSSAALSYIDDLDDEDQLQPPPCTQLPSHSRKSMLIDIVSGSELDEEEGQVVAITSNSNANHSKPSSVLMSAGPPPSKRVRTSTPQRHGSGANNKYINNDLPKGATDNNEWRRHFISTVAHISSTYKNAWSIPDDKLQVMLQKVWDTVYTRIAHTVEVGDAVYSIAKQSLSNWQGGFASAAVAVITAFFASDDEFTDAENRQAFAEAMIVKNRFLFSNNKGLNPKAWSGLWRSPFILQTFAHHYNYIQGHSEVVGLPSGFEGYGACGALALACAAVARVLTLVSEGSLTFQSTDSASSDMWVPYIPKKNQFKFNENIWGSMTQRYLAPIENLSDSQFDLVVDETQQYVKVVRSISGSFESTGDDDFDDLFAFR